MFKSWDEYTELEQAAATYSDFYKDVHGVRPRFTAGWTLADFDSAFVSLEADAVREFAFQRESDAQAVVDFEATVAATIEIGAGDRETAIRWILDATFDDYDRDTVDGDPTYFNYRFHLPTNYNWRKGAFRNVETV